MNQKSFNFRMATLTALVSTLVSTSAFCSGMTLEEALAKHNAEEQRDKLASINNTDTSSAPLEDVVITGDSDNQSDNTLTPGYSPVKSATDDTIYLSDAERLLIDAKKDAILKHLIEQDKLSNARDALKEDVRKEALTNAMTNEFRLTPAEIRLIKQKRIQISKAQNTPVSEVKLQIKTIDIDVDAPKPITVKVKNGYASSIVFYDQAGNTWPIEGDVIGDPSNFSKKITTPDKNIAVFDIIKDFKQSNALVNLVGLNLPIVLKLTGTNDEVDARMSIRLPKLGPNSQGLITTGDNEKVSSLSPTLMSILNGDQPAGSSVYNVDGVDKTTALLINGKLYIRTTSKLLSPPPLNSAKSPTGYNAYEIYPVNKLLFSEAGELKNATIEKALTVKIKHKTVVFD